MKPPQILCAPQSVKYKDTEILVSLRGACTTTWYCHFPSSFLISFSTSCLFSLLNSIQLRVNPEQFTRMCACRSVFSMMCMCVCLFVKAGSSSSGGGLRVRTGSTWSNVLSKVKLMVPYVWPKGNVMLQLTVILCLIILGAGRVLNVFVPIYSKYIGDILWCTVDDELVCFPNCVRFAAFFSLVFFRFFFFFFFF